MTNPTTREKFIVPIGPQHPALKEPGHFEFTVDGEIVTSASRAPGLCPPRHRKRHRRAQLDPEPVPARTHLRHLLAHPRHCLLPGRGETGRVSKRRRAPRPSASWSPSWNASTATCCGWVWPRMKPVLTPCSCTPGATAKRSWTCWKASPATGSTTRPTSWAASSVTSTPDSAEAIRKGWISWKNASGTTSRSSPPTRCSCGAHAVWAR